MRRFLLILLLLTLNACSFVDSSPLQTQPEPATVPETTSAPETPSETSDSTLQQIRNAQYQLGFPDQPRTVQLMDGIYQEGTDANYVAVRIQELSAIGDLNQNGTDEIAVLFAENFGGSGVFVFLTVYEIRNNTPVFLTSIFVDDRPQLTELSINSSEISLGAIIHNFDDALCCPTLPTKRLYKLTETGLLMLKYSTKTPSGTERAIDITSPLNSVNVSGVVNIKGNITIAPFENNLVYRIYDAGGVEMVAGPITVEAADLGAPGTFDKAIDLTAFVNSSIRIVIQDISAADGSVIAMDTVLLNVR